MNPNDIRTVVMGIAWIFFFFAPLIMALAAGDEPDHTQKPGFVIFALLLQLAFMISIGHSWGK
jgi:hypothetical protein